MNAPTADSVREGVLRRMERQANTIRLLIVGAAGVEALLLALALRIADLKNPTHVLIFVTSASAECQALEHERAVELPAQLANYQRELDATPVDAQARRERI